MMIQAQRWLRRLYGRLEITVESNPSSNLIVGHYEDLRHHPAFRLRPLDGFTDAPDEPILLSINTDDPVTFATCLADEYAHLYFALLSAEVPSQNALRWLEEVRECGWTSRFTLEASQDREVLKAVAERRIRA